MTSEDGFTETKSQKNEERKTTMKSLLEWLQQWSGGEEQTSQPFGMTSLLSMTNSQNDQPFGIGQPFRIASVVELDQPTSWNGFRSGLTGVNVQHLRTQV